MLNINQKYVILGQPFQMNWEIRSRFQTCLMYLPLDRWYFFWKNWSLVPTRGDRIVETHDSHYLTKKNIITVKIYKFRWYRILLTGHIEGKLDTYMVESKFKEVELQQIPVHFNKVNTINLTLGSPIIDLNVIKMNHLNPTIKSRGIQLKSNNLNINLKQNIFNS